MEFTVHDFLHDETGSASVEYALCVLGAAMLGGVLIAILISDQVSTALAKIITDALSP
ncbi:DUF4244 domain-containing protein [Actinokineospora cianjurensis]|uniref:Uncharacterized protein DUF4244 n=1 Tax=Actinokineospora cianjurensis TaxID=585224 RepID=A0A421B5W5_9PSEU|nr:DUF4244 domain-containing protein [Actinokineospora cianjurensis]RLK59882.1 uncharacterized protein DUF4244 [Actinokineospora cianjurensis]